MDNDSGDNWYHHCVEFLCDCSPFWAWVFYVRERDDTDIVRHARHRGVIVAKRHLLHAMWYLHFTGPWHEYESITQAIGIIAKRFKEINKEYQP